MDDSLDVMYDSIHMMCRATQSYSILLIGTVAPGKGAREESSRLVFPFFDLVAGYLWKLSHLCTFLQKNKHIY